MASDMRAVGLEFFDTASHSYVYNSVIRRPPERVFDALAHPASWGDWFPGFDRSGQWLTDGEPGTGSRRRVRMARIHYDETILAWEPSTRFAFRVDRATVPMARALAEDYRIGPHPSGCTLQWMFAIEPGGALRPALRWFDPVLTRLFRRVSANLEGYLGR